MVGGEPLRPRLPRQRSLQQELYRDLGPGPAHRARPPLARASSEGGEEGYDPALGGYGERSRGQPGQHNISMSGERVKPVQ